MRLNLRGHGAVALALALVACIDGGPRNPVAPEPRADALTTGTVRISEFHYDNTGTDAGEFIEVTGPAGMDLTGWSIARYNGGTTGTAAVLYTSPAATSSLAGVIPATCGAEGVKVVTYPQDGLQNGPFDGFALVDNTGHVVEFLSYEGTVTAASGSTNGPAAGMTSTDIGVSQSSAPLGQTLQRNGLGGWAAAASTQGACNDQPPPPYTGPTTVVIDEIMGSPLAAQSESWGEWFEVHNYGTEPVNLAGWKIRSGGSQPEHTISGDVIVAPGAYVVLGRSNDKTKNGGVTVAYNYFSGSSATIWLDANDWIALRTPTNTTVDSVAWTNTLAQGATRALRDETVDNADADGANWAYSTTTFGSGDFGTPNAANTGLSDVAPAVPTGIVRITFSGRDDSDPQLPVGFEDQIFASAFTAGSPNPVPATTTFTWSSDTPAIATVDQDGVVHANAAGVAIIRATAADGRAGLYEVPTRVAVASTTAHYADNTEFGTPVDADASDDFIITRPEYTISYSSTRNTPNWVSYDLENTHFGPEDRCDCFTHDPALPGSYTHLTTADYTGAGTYAGYGIDRGHLVRSADRTSASLDNAYTFYMSNIIPQAADLNQGPWANMETFYGNMARAGTSEVYVIAGVAGSNGTLKGQGKVVIPTSVWKVVVVMPKDQGLASVDDASDFQLMAVDMPNVAGVRNVDWHTYATTVNAIEAETGYDVLALLPDHVEWLAEAGYSTPTAATASQLLDAFATGVREAVVAHTFTPGFGDSFLSKIADAQTALAAGDAATARETMRALKNQTAALARVGQLDADAAESIGIFADWVIAAAR